MAGENLGSIYYTVDAKDGALLNAEKRIDKSVDNTTKSFKGLDQAGKKAFGNLTKVTVALAAAFATARLAETIKGITTAAIDFNASISNLSAITGAVGNDLLFLRDAALEFGSTTTLSATEAAEALKLVASAKPDLLESGDALKEVTKQAILLSEASGGTLSLADAAKTVGASLNQFSLEAEEAARVVNVLAAGAKFGSSEVNDTAAALKDAGVSAAGAAVSFEEANAAIQVLAKGTVKGAQAGTALRNIILILETSVDKTLKPSINGLAGALDNLDAQNLSTTELLKIFGRENVNAAQLVLNNRDALKSLTSEMTGTGTATEQASTNVNNLAGDLKAMNSVIESLQISIGSLADDELRTLTQTFTQMLSALNGNAEAMKEWGDVINGVAKTGEALAVVLAGKLIASTIAYSAELTTKTAATVASINAENAAAAATLRRAEAEKISALALVSTAKLDLQATANTNAYAFAKANLTRQSSLAAVAVGNYNKAVLLANAANAKAIASTTALGIAMRGASGIMALLGGPAGIAIIAATAIAYYYATAETASEKTARLSGEVDTLAASFTNLNEVQRGIEIAKLSTEMDGVRQELIAASTALNNWQEQLKNGNPQAAIQVTKYKNEVESLTDELNNLSVKQQGLFKSGIDQVVLKSAETVKKGSDEIVAAEILIDEALINQRAQLLLTADLYEEYALRKKLAAAGASEAVIAANVAELKSIQDLRNAQIADEEAAARQKDVAVGIVDLASSPLQKLQMELQAKYDLIAEYELLEVANHEVALAAKANADAEYLAQVMAMQDEQSNSFVNSMAENGASLEGFQASAVGAFTAFATGAQSGEEAIRGLAQSILTQMIGALVQMGIQALIGQTTAAAGAVATGATIATAMATPAALASLASFGTNAAPAAAGITATVGLAEGLALAGARRYGGDTSANSMYKVNEGGRPEVYSDRTGDYLMTGKGGGTVTSNSDLGGSQPVINISTINNAPSTGVQVEQSTSNGVTDVKFIIDTIANDMRTGGKTRRAVTSSTTAKNRVV